MNASELPSSHELANLRRALSAAQAQHHLTEILLDPDRSVDVAVEMLAPLSEAEVRVRRAQVGAPMELEEFRTFSRSVWTVECPGALPLQVNRIEDLPPAVRARDFDPLATATARWARPYADQIGIPRTDDLAGTQGAVPYIDTTDEGLNRITATHEIAHLIVDTETSVEGHSDRWATRFTELIEDHLDPSIALEWSVLWDWFSRRAEAHAAEDPWWPRQWVSRIWPATLDRGAQPG